jgi:hypothetical protein
MYKKLNSEYCFTRQIKENVAISLTVYINYDSKTYNITQNHQEGIFFRTNNTCTIINKEYMLLGLEALEFIENELYGGYFKDEEE